MSFAGFLRAEEFPALRPKPTGLAASTADQYERLVRQIYREGLSWDGERRPWEETPPDWRAIYAWRNAPARGGIARLESHRKALVWLASLWSLNGTQAPLFIQGTWEHAKAVRRATEAGTLKKRSRFFRLPDDVATLLSGHPFEDRLKRGRCAKSRTFLRQARFNDAKWRTMVHLGFYTMPRQGEFATLRLEHVDLDAGEIRGWPQPKKHMATRDVSCPEPWALKGDGRLGPCLEWYVRKVRPLVVDPEDDHGFVFVTDDGKPYSPRTVRNFVSDGIHEVLGSPDVSGHALRRGGITWRYHHGWSVENLAVFVDDEPDVVRASYLDQTWLRRVGRKASRKRYPLVEWIRPAGHGTRTPKTGRVPEIPLSKLSAPAGI